MLAHHRGAIALSDAVIAKGSDPKVRAAAQKTKADQTREVAMIEAMLAGKPMATASVPPQPNASPGVPAPAPRPSASSPKPKPVPPKPAPDRPAATFVRHSGPRRPRHRLCPGSSLLHRFRASAASAVFKWDRDGALIWARNVSGPFINGGWIDASGNVYLAGAYYSSNYYGWLAKLDTSGTLQWQRSLNGSGQELWYNAAVDASGNVYVAGYSTSSGGSGNADALIAKYNSAGTLLWQRSIGGSGNEYASQMALSPDGSLLVLAVSSTAMVFSIYTMMDFSPYG